MNLSLELEQLIHDLKIKVYEQSKVYEDQPDSVILDLFNNPHIITLNHAGFVGTDSGYQLQPFISKVSKFNS